MGDCICHGLPVDWLEVLSSKVRTKAPIKGCMLAHMEGWREVGRGTEVCKEKEEASSW